MPTAIGPNVTGSESTATPVKTLKRWFGFRQLQEYTADEAMLGIRVAFILPTLTGKSIYIGSLRSTSTAGHIFIPSAS